MKISFDFDSTLGEVRVQRLARKFIDEGHEVWIITSREKEETTDPKWNRDIFSVAKKLNIPKENIKFSGGVAKWKYLEGFDIHFDDSIVEIEAIEENLNNCVGVLILDYD